MDLAERLRTTLSELDDVELAVLFGSAAQGRLTSHSDVDLGLRLRDSSVEARRVVEVAVGRAVRRVVDAIYLDEAPPQLRFEIARDGVILICRDRDLWVDFKTRAMIDWWDWQPTASWMHRIYARKLRERLDGQG